MTVYKDSIDAFLQSDEGIKAADPTTLGASPSMRRYLENRLHSAFAAGFNAKPDPPYHCNICGGQVDLSNATKPTEKVGPGPKFQTGDQAAAWLGSKVVEPPG